VDEKLEAFRDRRLGHTLWPYLMVDARHETVRVDGRVVSQAVLVVIGFTAEGRREVLDWRVGDSEAEAFWGKLFRDLKDRGLGGVERLVSDAHGGVRAAMARHFQGAAWQRCRVHFKRELMRPFDVAQGEVSHKRAKELMKDAAAAVFAPDDRKECLQRAGEMADKWRSAYPPVAAMFEDGAGDCLTVLSMPLTHRKRLASTNMAENLMRRLKKRTKVVCIFPNRASCDRLIGAQLLEAHGGWLTEPKAYFNMGTYKTAPPGVASGVAA
jgi:transposase-like protein